MKVLLCFSSMIREPSALLFRSFLRNVVDPLDEKPDIIGTFSLPEHPGVSVLASRAAKHQFLFEKDPEFRESQLVALKGASASLDLKRHDILRNLYQWHSLRKCADLATRFHTENGYDLIAWFRPDLYFVNPLPFERPKSNEVFVSPHDAWGGINDRYCFGHPEAMMRRMRVFDYFVERWPGFVEARTSENPAWVWNPERVLRTYLSELKVTVRHSVGIALRARQLDGKSYVVVPLSRGVSQDPSTLTDEHEKQFSLWMRIFGRLQRLPFVRADTFTGLKRVVPLSVVRLSAWYMRSRWRRSLLAQLVAVSAACRR